MGSKEKEEQGKFDEMVDTPGEAPEEGGGAIVPVTYGNSLPDPEDVDRPHLRLAQGLTEEVQSGSARPGQWLLTGFEPVAEVTFIPLAYAKTFEHRNEDDAGTTPCDNPACELREWTGPKDARKPPVCTKVFNYLGYSVDHDALAVLKFRRSGERAGKRMNTVVARGGLGNVAVKLSAAQQQGPKGTYFLPVVAAVQPTPEALKAANERMKLGY